jgi:hypothetical protein
VTEDPVQFVVSELLSDFEHSLDIGDYSPIVDVEPHIRYTDDRVTSFRVKLKDGRAVEITGRLVS